MPGFMRKKRSEKAIKPHNSSVGLGTLYNRHDSTMKIVSEIKADQTKAMRKIKCRLLCLEACPDKRRLYAQLGFNRRAMSIIEKQQSSVNTEVLGYLNSDIEIHKNMRLIHYVHRIKKNKLRIGRHGTHISHSPEDEINKFTHMVTKTIEGVEILLVLHTRDENVTEIDHFLQKVCKRLQNHERISGTLEKKADLLKDIQVQAFGMKENNGEQKSFSDILNDIDNYLRLEKDLVLIEYGMEPLELLFDRMRYNYEPTATTETFRTHFNQNEEEKNCSVGKYPTPGTLPSKLVNDEQDYLDSSDTTEWDRTFLDAKQNESMICQGSHNIMFTVNCLPESQSSSVDDKTNSNETQFQTESKQDLIQYLESVQLEYVPFENVEKKVQEQRVNRKKQGDLIPWNDRSISQGNDFPPISFIKKLCSQIDEDNIQSFTHVSQSSKFKSNIIFEIFLWESVDASHTEPEEKPSEIENERKEITVLLLGESGVGKSTFINALVNYLTFDTFEDAEKSDSIALIPVSFLTTVSSNFDCVQVKYGDVDQNENHDKIGSSVTRRCRSYIFEVSAKAQIRLIDTPGFCDTSGIDQDMYNMREIFTYLVKIRHLNAICFLMKPDSSRLTIQFRFVFDIMLKFLPTYQRRSVLFCFTNTRPRFYSSAETGNLVRTLLREKDFDGVNFSQRNVFCFDSESFRFLMARKQNIEFDDDIIQEYKKSWTVSVKEAEKLLRELLKTSEINFDENDSANILEAEVRNLSHVFMETIRYLTYSLVLKRDLKSDKNLTFICEPSTNEFCSMCADIQRDFIEGLPLFQFRYSTKKCDHSNPNAFMIYYQVRYEFTRLHKEILKKESVNDPMIIFEKFNKLSYFLESNHQIQCKNIFKTMIDRFFDEQRQITIEDEAHIIANQYIENRIKQIRENLQQDESHRTTTDKQTSVNNARKIINELEKEDIIAEQIRCLREVQKQILKAEEKRVPFRNFQSERFSQLKKSYGNQEDDYIIKTRF